MMHIISYSGGVNSALTAQLVIQKYGKENVLLLFADTKIEDEDLYRFNNDVEKLLDIEILTISDGRNPWELFRDVKYIGNSRIDPCSKNLKRDLIKSWIHKNFDPDECIIYVGIDCSEEHRLARIVENNKPYQYSSILIEQDIFMMPEDKFLWCDINNIKIPRLYTLGFPHNNCGGFCVKTGLSQFKLLYNTFPERYLWHETMQEMIMKENPKLKPFLRKQKNNKLIYLTLKEYREQYLEVDQDSIDKYDFGGCGCGA